MQTLLLVLIGLPAIAWCWALLTVPYKTHRLPRLSQQPLPAGTLPRLSIVIAARNEAHTIEPALRSVLAQDYPDLEVIAVNDRSTDATGEILAGIARQAPRLKVITIKELPGNWLGKNHALQKGLQAATGEFVLFTDADVHFRENALRRALAYMQEKDFDHLSSVPELVNARPSMHLMMPAFSVFFMMMTQPWNVENPQSRSHMGVGAFNLCRRSALEDIGGLEGIRLRPDDDLMLGKLMKTRGKRSSYIVSDGEIAVQWYTTARETIVGLEKNSFAQFAYSPWRTTTSLLATLYLSLAPLAGVLALVSSASLAGLVGAAGLAGTGAMLGTAVLLSLQVRLPAIYGLAFPLGACLVVYATFRSMFLTLKRGGIIWRDTFYSLDQLRSNQF